MTVTRTQPFRSFRQRHAISTVDMGQLQTIKAGLRFLELLERQSLFESVEIAMALKKAEEALMWVVKHRAAVKVGRIGKRNAGSSPKAPRIARPRKRSR